MEDFVKSESGLLVPASVLQRKNATVYCDESGNSGSNYLDAPQPFYVLAGWLTPNDRIVEVSVAIEEFRQQNFPQREELKSASALRNDRTKRLCVQLFHQLGQLHCVPMYLIAEKRFCVAGKIVETFLDPFYNDLLKNAFSGDFETKQEIANTLYNCLPDPVIAQFAEAYRSPSASALAGALRAVLTEVEANVSPELSKAIEGCARHIDEIARVEAETSPLGNVAVQPPFLTPPGCIDFEDMGISQTV